jgi:hypothetical protein
MGGVCETNDKVENYDFGEDVERDDDLPPGILDKENPVTGYSLRLWKYEVPGVNNTGSRTRRFLHVRRTGGSYTGQFLPSTPATADEAGQGRIMKDRSAFPVTCLANQIRPRAPLAPSHARALVNSE